MPFHLKFWKQKMDESRPASAPPHEAQSEVTAEIHNPSLSAALSKVSKALSESKIMYPKEDGELSDSDSDSNNSNQKVNKNYHDELNKQLNQIKREQELTNEEETVLKTMNKNHSLQLDVLEENEDLLKRHLDTIQKKREELQKSEEAYKELASVEAENIIHQASKNLPRNKFTEIIKQAVREELAQLAESQRIRQRKNATLKGSIETDEEDVPFFDTVSDPNHRPFSSSEDRRKKKGVKSTKMKRTKQRDQPSSSSSSESSSGSDGERIVSKNNISRKREKEKTDKNIDNENQKTDNDSFISNPSSIFDDCPYKRLVYQLKKVITRAKTRITDSRNEKEILDMTLEKIKSAQKLYYQRAPKLKNLSHHEQDYLEYLEEELEALQITVA